MECLMDNVIKSDILNEVMHFKKLKNGLEIYVLPKPGFNKQFAIYATRYGSNDISFIVPGEKEVTTVPLGIAHFLEHKLFEEEEGNVFDDYANLGAQPNAFTNFNATAYHFTTTDNFYESLDVLVGFVGRPYFTEENVDKEKGIIAQEILMYEDNANWKVFFNMLGGLYENHPVKNDIAGTVESIHQIDADLLYKCYNTFYHPSNMVLFVVGDVDPSRIFDQVESHFGKNMKKQKEIQRIYEDEPNTVVKRQVREEMAVSRPLFSIGFKDTPLNTGGKPLLKRIMINDIIADMFIGPTSDLYSELYEQGLIDTTFGGGYVGEKDYGYMVMSGETSDVDRVLDEIEKGIARIKSQKIDRELFLQAKKGKMGQFIRNFNYLEGLGHMFVSLFVKDVTLFDYMEVLDGITYGDVEDQLAQVFNEDLRTVSIIEPAK